MKIELKPCPFCGGVAKYKKHSEFPWFHFIECAECGARSHAYDEGYVRSDELADIWNRRADNGSN